MKKSFVLLGPPGCGKGTQTEKIAAKFNLPHIDTGALLRAHIAKGTEFGIIAKQFIDKGQLAPTDIVGGIIKKRLSEDDCKNGYVLDGYPRSISQAEFLKQIQDELNVGWKKYALYFDIPMSVLVERLINRRSCPKCGMIYNLLSNKPKKDGYCDICDCELIQRKDDTKETALLRFETYDNQTKPLLDYYKDELIKINALGTIDEVWNRIEEIL